jgi:hypothetical protein
VALPWKKKLALWSIFFLFSRLLYLYFFVEHSWALEEVLRGTMALEFRNALAGQPLRLPLWCYQPDSYLGGSLVVALLTALHYFVFGITLFSLKLSALWFAWGTLCLGYLLLREEIGESAADAFALLYTFCSPGLLSMSLVAMGYHTESVLFLMWLLLLALRERRSMKNGETSQTRRFLLGAVAGFAFWFSPLNALGILSAFFLLPETFWTNRKSVFLLVTGFLLGILPLLLHECFTHFSALGFFTSANEEGSPLEFSQAPLKLWSLLTHDLPLASAFPPALAYIVYSLLLGLVCFRWRTLAKPVRTFVLVYFLLFLPAFALGRFSVGKIVSDAVTFRYLQQAQFLLLLLGSIALSAGNYSRLLRALLVTSSLYGILSLDLLHPAGRLFQYRPYSYAHLGARAANACFAGPDSLVAFQDWLHSYPLETQRYLSVAYIRSYPFDRNQLSDGLDHHYPRENPTFAYGLGLYAGASVEKTSALLSLGNIFSPETATRYWEGVAEGSAGGTVEPELYARLSPDWYAFQQSLSQNAKACLRHEPLRPEKGMWAIRGQGAALVDCGIFVKRTGELAENLRRDQNQKFRDNLAWGLGWRLRFWDLPDPLRSLDRLSLLPSWAFPQALQGAALLESQFELPTPDRIGNSPIL